MVIIVMSTEGTVREPNSKYQRRMNDCLDSCLAHSLHRMKYPVHDPSRKVGWKAITIELCCVVRCLALYRKVVMLWE